MIPAPTQVWLVVEPIDMRAGIDVLRPRFFWTRIWGKTVSGKRRWEC